MSDCCNVKSTHPKKHRCPANGQAYVEVSAATMMHHLAKPWAWDSQGETYYFCDDPDCEVVYFSASNKVFTQDKLRTQVGQKDRSELATLCYCFGVSRGDYQSDVTIKAYVMAQTKNKTCACGARNPSGRCCLKDFPRHAN